MINWRPKHVTTKDLSDVVGCTGGVEKKNNTGAVGAEVGKNCWLLSLLKKNISVDHFLSKGV